MVARVVAVAAGAAFAVLAAACSPSPQGPAGAATTAVLHAFGKQAYRLGAQTRTYSAEVIVEQVRGGFAVLAAGGYYAISAGVCAPRLAFAFYVDGQQQFQWNGPASSRCLTRYASGYHRVCLPGSHRKGGSAPVTRTRVRRFRAAGCDHPVLPLDAAVDAMLTGENPQTARQHTVESVGIVLLPRRDASGEQ